jgi:hypothetical protein
VPDYSSFFTPIHILEGDYKDCIYHYGKTQLVEDEDEYGSTYMRVKFDYTMLENPSKAKEDQDFVDCAGNILVEILDKQMQEDASLITVVSNDEAGLIGNHREDNFIESD